MRYQFLQITIRLLPGDRLLALSGDLTTMVFRFVIGGGAGFADPTLPHHITKPLWRLSIGGPRIVLSEGFSDDIATYFVVKTSHVLGLVIPHNGNQESHLRRLTVFNSSGLERLDFATGFEKALILDGPTRRLSFSWQDGITGSCSAIPGGVNSTSYPSAYFGSRVPQLDEETGRIVQDSPDKFQVVDTAVVYSNTESEEEQ